MPHERDAHPFTGDYMNTVENQGPRGIRLLPVIMLAAATALAAAHTGNVHAQGYPSKPIRLIVPLAPGGGNDPLGGTPEDFTARIKTDIETMAKVMRDAGMQLN